MLIAESFAREGRSSTWQSIGLWSRLLRVQIPSSLPKISAEWSKIF